ncbi:MAG: nitrous oxide reductase family maturation protein NosD [Reichenbachiella sp.]
MITQLKHIIFAMLIGIPIIAKSTILEVCQACEIKSIEKAVQYSESYDTLMLAPEDFVVSNLEIKHPLVIVGDKGTILDGNEEGYILKILSDSVHISGLNLINAGRSFTKDFAAIYVSRSSVFSITNCEIIEPYFGILIEKSHHGLIRNNHVYGSMEIESDAGNGIHLWHSSHIQIQDNELHGMRDGIYFEFVTDSQIERNYSYDNIRYGLHFMFSNDDEYYDNRFRDNGAGVAVMFSKNIIMKRNEFAFNWGSASYGLLLKEIYDAEVEFNKFEQNTIGIFLEGSTRINYKNNSFISNGWAVKVSGGCYKNVFNKNDFISNSLDVSYNSKMNDNLFEGNYWSEYNGYDLDKNGEGDVPYRPVKLFSYIVSTTPESIVLLRSLFIDILNFSERISPIFTPDDLQDTLPSMQPCQ